MRQHLITAAVAAVTAACVGYGSLRLAPAPKAIVSVNASRHVWPDLTQDETIALGEKLAPYKDSKVIIFCNDAACSDLAYDLDDAFQIAGIDSAVEHSLISMGSGFGIAGDADDARVAAIANAISGATGARIAPQIVKQRERGRVISIAIGKRQ
jgi:hypothetical protein